MLHISKNGSFRKLFTSLFHRGRALTSKVPDKPVPFKSAKLTQVSVSRDEVALLERLSLVKCNTGAGLQVLEDAIAFAEDVLRVPADSVDPMHTVLESKNLPLRDDKVTEGDCQKDILKNSALIEEDYFVAPPGNIPLQETNPALQTEQLQIIKKELYV